MKSVSHFIFTTFLAWPCLICLPVSAKDTGTIKGRVVDKQVGEPLYTVNVVIKGTYFGRATDLNGEYEIRSLEPGSYVIEASMIGYLTAKQENIIVYADSVTIVNFEIKQELHVPCEIAVYEDTIKDIEPEEVVSTELQRTSITCYLNRKIIPGENLIYCSTFQMAWDRLAKEIIGDEIAVEGDPEIVEHLNKGEFCEDDIAKESYVATSGKLTQQFILNLKEELQQKFGNDAPEIGFSHDPTIPQIISYAYLFKNIRFLDRFETIQEPIKFQGSDGEEQISGFGIEKFDYGLLKHHGLRDQFEIVEYEDPDCFILFLEGRDKKDMIVLAKVKPEKTLLETVQRVDKRVRGGNEEKPIMGGESLQIPKLNFKVVHGFQSLEGKYLRNFGWEGWVIQCAKQMIRLKLDEKGAIIKSEAGIIVGRPKPPEEPRKFIFDKPFLMYLQEKNGNHPYFVMWVDNAEMLQKF